MPKVLHIGPCDSPGGMANVMNILAEHPPEGWEAELLASHVVGSPWAKWRAYRKARSTLIRRLNDPTQRPDVVHLHTAADWSWWRKRRFALLAHAAGCKIVVHIHSGKFDQWLGNANSKKSRAMKSVLRKTGAKLIVLNEWWQEQLEPLIGDAIVVHNPVRSTFVNAGGVRNGNHLLLLGRNDPVKGHKFAMTVCAKVREEVSDLKVTMTGITSSPYHWLEAKGWVSDEEKLELLQTASLLLVPSAFEGEPMVVIEAISCGLPVLCSDRVHSLPSAIEVAPFENEAVWASKIIHLLREPTDSNQLRAQSKSFEIRAISTHWNKIYQGLLTQ
ncbi:glycosyltransferase family 4 protein [Candidatus Poseidoniales archaeon]|nr:glycosyltransferase family 4 protein [Candidatus Poseidoniales archaeon]